ncbi:MAG: hypothetical protein IJR97_11340, partial [Clostridia bacterium]|nr:hypothetical protein [Clostridia bacterium]
LRAASRGSSSAQIRRLLEDSSRSARFRPPVSATGGGRLRAPPIPPLLNEGYVVLCLSFAPCAGGERMRRRPRTDLCNSQFQFFCNPAALYLLSSSYFVSSGSLFSHMFPFHIILPLLLVRQRLFLYKKGENRR